MTSHDNIHTAHAGPNTSGPANADLEYTNLNHQKIHEWDRDKSNSAIRVLKPRQPTLQHYTHAPHPRQT